MKKNYIFYVLCFGTITFSSCEQLNLTPKCIADVTVSALDAPGAVIAGNPIGVICSIKNVISAASSSCTDSGEIDATMDVAYSPIFSDNFEDYRLLNSAPFSVRSLSSNEEIYEEMVNVPTSQKGYYAIRVNVESAEDRNADNNSRAIAISAN